MPVLYDSKAIIPAPFVSISKEFQTTEDGTIVGTSFVLSIKGKLVPDKGSPNSAGTFWTSGGYPPDENLTPEQRMASLLRKQEAIRRLFSAEGRSFEIQPLDGSAAMKCNPRVRKPFEVQEGQWFNDCSYSIILECDVLYGTLGSEDGGDPTNYKVSKGSEEWNIEPGDERARTYRLSHNVQATGKRFYDNTGSLLKPAWQNAQDYVLGKIGLGIKPSEIVASGVIDGGTLQAYNYMRTQHANELGGSFGVTETWICFDPGSGAAAFEDFTVNARTAENGLSTVGIDGTITGYEQRDNTSHALVSSRYTNASAKWLEVYPTLLSRAQNLTGINLNPTPLGQVYGANEANGVINYSHEFSNRAVPTITGAITENITVNENHPNDLFASIPVLGRALGPVLQGIGTVTAKKKSISIEVVMPGKTMDFTPTQPSTNALILSFLPVGASSFIFVENDTESWSETTGRASRSVSFVYE